MELIGGKFFGFRGGEESALIDNILIYSKEPNSIIREFFSNFNISTVLVMMISLVTFSILTLMFSGIKHFHNNHNVSLLNMLITLLLCSIYLADYFVFSTRYPLREYRSLFFNRVLRDRESAYSRNGSFEFIKENNNNYYLQQLNKDTVRIMFIGSSQTWGAGAVKESDTSVKVLEQKINMWLKERGKVQCINYSVSGLDSGALYKIYKSECLKFRPKICVVILSYNDRDEKVFSKNLQNFIDLNRSLNIRTIFVLEANSIEINQGSPPLHKAMRAIGENNGIAVVDLHSFLVENYDQGFLWWDCVHLTNFGQQLAAECLFDALHKEIDIVADKI
jgi:lysophospholipase L1-like esterase